MPLLQNVLKRINAVVVVCNEATHLSMGKRLSPRGRKQHANKILRTAVVAVAHAVVSMLQFRVVALQI